MKVRLPNNGGANSMQQMLQQAQQMQQQMEEKRAELDAAEYEVAAGGGAVKVRINGKRQILSILIEPDVVDPDDVETLQDIITAAVNEAIKKVDAVEAEEMARITGPMSALGGMPGMF
ncbi:MAG: YbaB/EbfC family nucleoid-associated protein [Clostridia bacterium]|nr:YbaB/EbfC family nucleoid-associated protein [Clostridia bacterium]